MSIDRKTAMEILYGNKNKQKSEKETITREQAKAILFGSNGKVSHYVRFYYFTHPELDTPECYETYRIPSRNLEDIILPSYCQKFEIFDAVDDFRPVDGKLVNFAHPKNVQRYFVADVEEIINSTDRKGGLLISAVTGDGRLVYAYETDILISPRNVIDGHIIINQINKGL